MDIQIKSDGTFSGTVVKINGKTITESGNITSVSFNVDIGKEWASAYYSVRTMDDKGVSRSVTYNVRPDSDSPMRVTAEARDSDNALLDIDRSVGDAVHKVITIDRDIDPRFRDAASRLMKDTSYIFDDEGDIGDDEIDTIDSKELDIVLDDPELNEDAESLETRFKSCKRKVGGPAGKSFAVCAYLNPKISPKRRAQLKSRMIKNRGK